MTGSSTLVRNRIVKPPLAAMTGALLLLLSGCVHSPRADEPSPPPAHQNAGALATGNYRNLFVEAGHSAAIPPLAWWR